MATSIRDYTASPYRGVTTGTRHSPASASCDASLTLRLDFP